MKRVSSLALSALLALAGPAAAATLATAPVRVGDNPGTGHILQCAAVNVGHKNVTVGIEASAEDVEILPPQVLAPGETAHLLNLNGGPGARPAWCRFVIVSGKKSHVRGTACALDSDANCRAALPAR